MKIVCAKFAGGPQGRKPWHTFDVLGAETATWLQALRHDYQALVHFAAFGNQTSPITKGNLLTSLFKIICHPIISSLLLHHGLFLCIIHITRKCRTLWRQAWATSYHGYMHMNSLLVTKLHAEMMSWIASVCRLCTTLTWSSNPVCHGAIAFNPLYLKCV